MDNQYAAIVEYIDQHLKAGISPADIRTQLLQHGWTEDQADTAFAEHHKAFSTPLNEPQASLPGGSKKYGFVSAARDVVAAISYNPIAYICSMAAVFVLATIIIAIIPSLALTLDSPLVFIVIALFMIPIVANSIQAYSFSIMSSLIKAQQSGKKLLPAEPAIAALAVTRRITLANLLCNVIIYGPIIVLYALWIIMVFSLSMGLASLLMLLLMPLTIIWLIIAALQFCLAPVVAQEEPAISIVGTLKRSSELLNWRTRLAIVGAFILALIVSFILSATDSDNLAVLLFQLVMTAALLTFLFGIISAIYFNQSKLKQPTVRF